MEMNNERVVHPQHYQRLKDKFGIEVWDIAEEYGFIVGNAIKYLMRAGDKPEEGMSMAEKEIEDYLKAIEYIRKKIRNVIADVPLEWRDHNKDRWVALVRKLHRLGLIEEMSVAPQVTNPTCSVSENALAHYSGTSSTSQAKI